ncbi:hypothetical protein B0H13DRAFT_1610580 [Mycena leptocephala]|nr:hypothetical protein B0H13DRAFT_1610580 [Mycena leptocephala]
MRQTEMTEEDNKLRIALENMRYGACTEDDLIFLRSRIAGLGPESPRLNAADIRNVSIISARNTQKDLLNELGARRFARDTNQELEEFCSTDKLSSRAVDKQKWKNCSQSTLKSLNAKTRQLLWNSMPSTTTDFIPGKLLLCIGIPVMLRSNDATELCITKGQEAVVVGWDSSVGPAGQKVLDTLFVRLVNPPREVKIDGLPLNVVPLPRSVNHITCLLPDDSLISVSREQVVVLLNFGMTDFTAQGKSREKNVVELSYCKGHRSYYVALSRGTSAAGTVILQDFDEKNITSGMHGHLRQELRELETLDEITKLRFMGRLPASVTGIYRRRLIRSYYAWKTNHRDPDHFHPAIKWKPELGPRIPESIEYSEWKSSIPQNKKRKNARPKFNVPTLPGPGKQQSATVSTYKADPPAVSMHLGQLNSVLTIGRTGTLARPIGFIWDNENWSCAYDSLFTILLNLWMTDTVKWRAEYSRIGTSMSHLSNQFYLAVSNNQSLESSRDNIRAYLHGKAPGDFPYGLCTTSIDKLASAMLPDKAHGIGKQACTNCGYRDQTVYGVLEYFISAGLGRREIRPEGVPLSTWLDKYFRRSRRACPACSQNFIRSGMVMTTVLHSVPSVMLIFIDSNNLTFDYELTFRVQDRDLKLQLKGIIYGGSGHFTCRIVRKDRWIWFHDGITTKRQCVREFHFDAVADKLQLHVCREKNAVAVVYAHG